LPVDRSMWSNRSSAGTESVRVPERGPANIDAAFDLLRQTRP
jgi:hypothetical protein